MLHKILRRYNNQQRISKVKNNLNYSRYEFPYKLDSNFIFGTKVCFKTSKVKENLEKINCPCLSLIYFRKQKVYIRLISTD